MINLKDKYFLPGIAVLTGSFILYRFSGFYFLLTIPFFAIGLFLILVSLRRPKVKLLIVFTSTLIFSTSYLFIAPKKTILIPSEYEGPFRIVYGEQCGIEPEVERGRPLLKIPHNGVLILKTNFTSDANNEYFLIDKKGNRSEVDFIVRPYNKITNLPIISIPYTASLGQSTPFVNFSEQVVRQMVFSDFYIFNRDTVDKLNDTDYDFLLYTDSIVRNCK